MLEEGELCSNLSNFNYKPQVERCQQHLALCMDCQLRSVAIMIEVTSCHTEYTRLNLDYSQMPALALHSLSINRGQECGVNYLNGMTLKKVGVKSEWHKICLYQVDPPKKERSLSGESSKETIFKN